MSDFNSEAIARLQAFAEAERLRTATARREGSLRDQARALLRDSKQPKLWADLLTRSIAFAIRARRERGWRLFLDNVETDTLNDPIVSAPVPRDLSEARRLYAMAAGRTPFKERDWGDPTVRLGAERLRELNVLAKTGIGNPPASASNAPAPGRTGVYLVNAALPETQNGYAVRTHSVARTLVETGHALEVLAISRLREDPSVETYRLDQVKYRRLRADVAPAGLEAEVAYLANLVERHAREAKAGLIHAASNWRLGWAGLIAARRLNIPFFYEVRGFWELTRVSVRPAYHKTVAFVAQVRLESDLAKCADRAFTLNKAMADELGRRGASEKTIALIPNGIGLEFEGTPPAAAVALVKRTEVVVAMIGTLTPYEGIDRLIEAVAALNSTGRQRVGLLIAGGGPAEETVRRAIFAKGAPDWAVVTGALAPGDMAACYRLADIAAFPRDDLPITRLVQPLKPVEAMAHGVAVVTSDLPSMREINESGERCRLVPPNNTAALTQTLADLTQDEDARAQLAESGASWARQERGWARTLAPLCEAYSEALSPR